MLESIKDNFHTHVRALQDQITQKLLEIDPSIKMIEDKWDREDFVGKPGGGGITRAFTGDIIENAGVNTSLVFGKVDPKFAASLKGDSDELWATGISLIIHPRNPKIPTTHANFRMIEQGDACWFGGGADLTPYYPIEEDFIHFHKTWKEHCDEFGLYKQFKDKCDEYFTNHHRTVNGKAEMRGIGGTFFDHYNSGDTEKDFNMVSKISEAFIPSYFPILDKRINESFNEQDVDFQLHRRGRYVEFNLLHDRRTHFGLKSNGRVDSILISLPGRCNFSYKFTPEKGSPHEKMTQYYFPKNWV